MPESKHSFFREVIPYPVCQCQLLLTSNKYHLSVLLEHVTYYAYFRKMNKSWLVAALVVLWHGSDLVFFALLWCYAGVMLVLLWCTAGTLLVLCFAGALLVLC